MNKPVGGRGHKAPYQTIVVRIPIDLKLQVDELVSQFREGGLEIKIDENTEKPDLDLKAIIERYRAAAKPSRDWVQFNKLIGELEQEIDK